MNVLIVSCGEASRLRHISGQLTKCLMPINGESALLKQVRYWQKQELVSKIYVITNKPAQVGRFLNANTMAKQINVLYHEKADGSAKAICSAIKQQPDLANEPLLIQWADLLLADNSLTFYSENENICVAQNGYGRYKVQDGKIVPCSYSEGNVSGIYYLATPIEVPEPAELIDGTDFADAYNMFTKNNWQELKLDNSQLIQFGDAEQMQKAEQKIEPVGSIKLTELVMYSDIVVKLNAKAEANWFAYWADTIKMPEHFVQNSTLVLKKYKPITPSDATVMQMISLVYNTYTSYQETSISRLVSKRICDRIQPGTLSDKNEARLDCCLDAICKGLDRYAPHGVIHGDLTFANVVHEYGTIIPIDPSNTLCNILPIGYDLGKILYGYYTWPACQANAAKLKLLDANPPAFLLDNYQIKLWCASHLLAAMFLFKQDARRTEWLVETNLNIAEELIKP